MKRIVISGYYGFGNVGDEAVLAGARAAFKELGVEARLTVLSADPERTMREHPGVDAIPRMKLLPVIRALRSADLFISGGGSLFQDATSARSPYYYLGALRLAQTLKCKTMIYAQGIGPLIRPAIRCGVQRAFNKADAITVRDNGSKALLQEIGVAREVQVAADPSFLVEPDLTAADKLIDEAGLAGKGLIGIALRPWPGRDEWLTNAARAIVDTCGELGAQPAFIPMQESEDTAVGEGAPVLRHGGSPETAKGLVARCRLVVGMRLHSLIFAAGASVPFVPIAYDPKVSAFAAEAGAAGVNIGDPVDRLCDAIRAVWNDRAAAGKVLSERSRQFREAALLSGWSAAKLLE